MGFSFATVHVAKPKHKARDQSIARPKTTKARTGRAFVA
jgi:hypothetical protein